MIKMFLITLTLTTYTITCPPNYYYSDASHTCVERPDHNDTNCTARCEDGTESHSRHPAGTCSSHGGVNHWGC